MGLSELSVLCLQFSVDATEEPNSGPRLGRLVNHGDKPRDRNARMKVLTLKNQPVLCLFSTKRISAGEQILYGVDNGDIEADGDNKDQEDSSSGKELNNHACNFILFYFILFHLHLIYRSKDASSELVCVQLFRSYCLPFILYATETIQLTNTSDRLLDNCVKQAVVKFFQVYDINNIDNSSTYYILVL